MTAFGECTHLAAILVYVDDFLAAGPRQVLQPLLTQLLHVWKGSTPDFLGREPGEVDTLRFLGLDIELGEQEGTWLVRQQSYIHAFLQEMFGEYLKDRRTPGEPDSYSNKPDHHAHKARVKHPVLRPYQDPLEHTPILRLVVSYYGLAFEHDLTSVGRSLGSHVLHQVMNPEHVFVLNTLHST